ncbi:Uma2 family endonuclease [Fimbriiglobus ruber]|uniref:Uma2 family endonuclease n=1 Tax=Fimbriiglobus ruber TaxID=1908690 RepID=UPI00137A720E|nr:Uma2 family endonuclease [Fimbriiglobus ruber]
MAKRQEDGTVTEQRVPLTDWDILHPQEGDFIAQSRYHGDNRCYLWTVFKTYAVGKPELTTLYYTGVDWQVAGIEHHAPDVTVIEGMTRPLDPFQALVNLRESGGRPVLVIEVTSPSTREIDLNEKAIEYHKVGIPYYVIVDTPINPGDTTVSVIGYQYMPEGYLRMSADPDRGIWIPTVGLWFRVEKSRVVCYTEQNERVLDYMELAQRKKDFESDIEEAKERTRIANAEYDELVARIAQMEAELRRLRGDSN